jgi:hypothetical protein
MVVSNCMMAELEGSGEHLKEIRTITLPTLKKTQANANPQKQKEKYSLRD